MSVVEYVWIGGQGELRSKIRILDLVQETVAIDAIPRWNYDGSSTGQATTENSEVVLIPRSLFVSPFHSEGLMVLCDTWLPLINSEMKPALWNHRHQASIIFDRYREAVPWYGLEQEYFIYNAKTHLPLGFENAKIQGQYYCSVGALNSYGREIVEEHLAACLKAGIQLSGINAEVAPGQWEFQIGPVTGIDAADQLWMARYILERIAEKHGTYIVYDPKPLQGDWNGSGGHTNFSTVATRSPGGLEVIIKSMKRFEERHQEHMMVYGSGNQERMSGLHETSSYDSFSYAIASRGASIRIPSETRDKGCGYFEDRRPAANADPYLVTAIILETFQME